MSVGANTCAVTTKVSTFDPTALDKHVPPVYIYLYGPFTYTVEQIRMDVKNNNRNFVAYTQRSAKLTFKIEATKVCAGTDLSWTSDYWYRDALYIETEDKYLLQSSANKPSILKLGEIYPRFVSDYGETCYNINGCTLSNAKARNVRTKA